MDVINLRKRIRTAITSGYEALRGIIHGGSLVPLASLHQEAHQTSLLIQCLQISKCHVHGQDVFSDANLQIQRGNFTFLVGPGGTGKSTLFRLLLGLESLDQGHILIEGRNLQHLRRREIPYFRRRIGVVFQDFKLVKQRTVFENVALPLEVAGKEHLFIRKKVHRILRMLRLDHRMNTPCSRLSAGERQMVAIARAVVTDPVILLVDEPTGNLDEDALRSAMDVFAAVHERGATVIVATHDVSLPSLIPGSRVVAIHQGKFMEKVFQERMASPTGTRLL